jgi:hypothetical protein
VGKTLAALAAAATLLLTPPLLLLVAVAAATTQATATADPPCAPMAAAPGGGGWGPPYPTGFTVTSRFGMRTHPITGQYTLHDGIDLAAHPTPGTVTALAAGTVVQAGRLGGYGLTVTVDHGAQVRSRSSHLARIHPAVTTGAVVAAGQPLGVEGSTGTSTGVHLHLSILLAGVAVDPAPFLAAHGAPLDGAMTRPAPPADAPAGAAGGFALPPPGQPRRDSLHNPPLPIPPDIHALYTAAAARYGLPWPLLAGIGMAETAHGATTAVSSAGARGLMQFMPATFAAMGVDGDGDGRAEITNPADSVHSAAHYLTRSGVHDGPDGVRAALFAYNHAAWYVNDVLFYAGHYGGGTLSAPTCPTPPA